MATLGVVASMVMLAFASPAAATWSVVAVEAETGRVGAAIASCVPADVLGDTSGPLVPVVLVSGVGAGISQGQFDVTAPARIAALLENGVAADGIIGELIDRDNDPLLDVRQHAVARLGDDGSQASISAHTGSETSPSALDRQAEGVSVQGNLLVSEAVVVDALATFERAMASGDELGSALVAALVAGGAAGGDRRCGEQSALFAQVVVAEPHDDPSRPSVILTVLVAEGDGQDPVRELAAAWSGGTRGLLDLAAPPQGTGPWFAIAVVVAVAAMLGGACLAFIRGMGSISARSS